MTVDAYGQEGQERTASRRRSSRAVPVLPALRRLLRAGQRGSDFAKLATLDQEGRSSATTLISMSIVRSLRAVPEKRTGRQRAQAAHLRRQPAGRGAAGRALQRLHRGHDDPRRAVPGGASRRWQTARRACTTTTSPRRSPARSAWPRTTMRSHPGEDPALHRRTEAALRDVVNLRVYLDLERGWRVTMPNLEQVGLLQVGYLGLDGVAANDELWRDCLPRAARRRPGGPRAGLPGAARRDAPVAGDRRRVLRRPTSSTASKRRGQEALRPEWAVDDADQRDAAIVYPGAGPARHRPRAWSTCPGGASSAATSSGRGRFPGYLRADQRRRRAADHRGPAAGAVRRRRGAAHRAREPRGAALAATGSARPRWSGGPATARTAPTTRWPGRSAARQRPRVNPYFVRLYREVAQTLAGLVAREHTAQVDPEVRAGARGRIPRRRAEAAVLLADDGARRRHRRPERRLHAQRAAHPGELRAALRASRPVRAACPGHHVLRHRQQPRPVLLPQLRQDGLRRRRPAPPRPAQRGPAPLPRPRDLDRRGRRPPGPGDPGVHRHGRHRAGGQAAARPATRAHRPRGQRASATAVRSTAPSRARPPSWRSSKTACATRTSWWDPGWVEHVVRAAPVSFDRAFDRWRDLFRAALVDQWEQNRRRLDYSLSQRDRDIAGRRRNEAETQLRLLRNEDSDDRNLTADFNPYRYLASEGFLPGYSFPRLPIAAYIPPDRRLRADGDYVQRARFLAIREFGPRALIYHEGARYEVHRVQLPPDAAGEVITYQAHRCPGCGYHHEVGPGNDRCEMCHAPLTQPSHRPVPAAHGLHQAAAADHLRRGGAPPRRVPDRHLLPVPGPRRPARPPRRDRLRRSRRRRSRAWPTATRRSPPDQPRPRPPARG